MTLYIMTHSAKQIKRDTHHNDNKRSGSVMLSVVAPFGEKDVTLCRIITTGKPHCLIVLLNIIPVKVPSDWITRLRHLTCIRFGFDYISIA